MPQPDDVLAQPARARLFALLGELKRPASTAELSERLGLHPNGVRRHLDALRRAELIELERRRAGRGRPRDSWSIAADAKPGGRPPDAYGELCCWLARCVPPSPSRLRETEARGREIARELAPAGESGPEATKAVMVALGFQPEVTSDPDLGDARSYSLGNCPYRDAAATGPEVVCALHRGITLGLLDVLEPSMRLAEFVPHDPHETGCVIRTEVAAERKKRATGTRKQGI